MSLIVVRKSENQLCIVSDTKLTHPDHETRRLKSNPSDGVIKTIIINPDVCISFAGEIDYAEKAFENIHADDSIVNIIEVLKKHHQQSQYKTEFVLCFGKPEPTIYKFKNNEYGSVATAWMGDQKAFNRFQESIMDVIKKPTNKKKQPTDNFPASNKPTILIEQMSMDMEVAIPEYFTKMSKAMDEVIDDSNISSVSGFKVNVIYKDKFYYNIYTKSYRGKFPIVGLGTHSIGHGDASEGAYSINFFGCSNNFNTVALHIRQANLGIAYHRKNSGLLLPILHYMDEVDFYDLVIERYDLHPAFSTMDRVGKFEGDGLKAFKDQKFEEALKLFEKAIKDSKENKKKAELFYFKGVTLLNLRKIPLALRTFQDAINIDYSIQQKINQVLRQRPTNK